MKKRLIMLIFIAFSCEAFHSQNPDFCENDEGCLDAAGGPRCDVAHHRCTTAEALNGPQLVSITPSSGKRAGGTVLTLNGHGFTPNMKVKFGSETVPATYISPTEITAETPLAPAVCGPVTVQVIAPTNQILNGQAQYQYRHARLAVSDTPRTLPAVSPVASSITAGDMNGDGNIDLVAANQTAPGLTLWYLQADGSISKRLDLDGTAYFDVKLANLDGGAAMDIVARAGSQIDFYRGPDFMGLPTASIPFANVAAFAVGDLNVSAFTDVVALPKAANRLASFGIGATDTMFTATNSNITIAPDGATDALVEDLNHDGIADIVAGLLDGSIMACFGKANTLFDCSVPIASLPGLPVQLGVVPVVESGARSLVFATRSAAATAGALYVVPGDLSSSDPQPLDSYGAAPRVLRIEDFDCDGQKDIILYVTAENALRVYLNQGNGQFAAAAKTVPLGLTLGATMADDVFSFTVTDLNRDASPDLALLKVATGGGIDGLVMLNASR